MMGAVVFEFTFIVSTAPLVYDSVSSLFVVVSAFRCALMREDMMFLLLLLFRVLVVVLSFSVDSLLMLWTCRPCISLWVLVRVLLLV